MDRLQALCRNLRVSVEGDVAVIASSSDEMAGLCQDELQAVLKYLVSECHVTRLVMDMSGVSHVSSFTVACIGYYARLMEDGSGRLVVSALGECCRKPFDLAGILSGLRMAPTREDGVQAARE